MSWNDVALQQGAETGLEKFWDAFTSERARSQDLAMKKAAIAREMQQQDLGNKLKLYEMNGDQNLGNQIKSRLMGDTRPSYAVQSQSGQPQLDQQPGQPSAPSLSQQVPVPSMMGPSTTSRLGPVPSGQPAPTAPTTMGENTGAPTSYLTDGTQYPATSKFGKSQREFQHMSLEDAKLRGDITKQQGDELERPVKNATAAAEAAIKTRDAKGINLPAEKATNIADANAATSAIKDSIDILNGNTDLMGPIQGRLAQVQGKYQTGETGKKAAAIEAMIDQHTATIGRYLEGGVLRPEMKKFYRDMMPDLNDSPEVAQVKAIQLQRLIQQRNQSEIETLKQANYNMGGIKTQAIPPLPSIANLGNKPSSLLKPAVASSPPKAGSVENGYKFIGGDPSKKENWKKQ